MPKEKSIGIIGGAGPMASCLLHQDDHPPKIFVLNYPFSEMILDRASKQNRKHFREFLQFSFGF